MCRQRLIGLPSRTRSFGIQEIPSGTVTFQLECANLQLTVVTVLAPSPVDRSSSGADGNPTQLEKHMRILRQVSAFALFFGIAAGIANSQDRHGLVVTASNTPTNNLLVYNTSNRLIQTIATGGAGGASGNAGGIAASHGRLAVVNFASQNVSIFERSERGFRLKQTVPTASNPLSVAFGTVTSTYSDQQRSNRIRCLILA